MFGVGVLELVLVLVVPIALLCVVAVGSVKVAARDDLPTSRQWLAVVGMRLLGGLVGLAVAVLLASVLDLGRGLVLAPAVSGLGVLVGVALGETVVRPRRTTGARSASLRPRSVWTYVPQPLGVAVGVLTLVHLATLALTTSTASADDLARAGRSFRCEAAGHSAAHGPYPGSFYSAPLLVVLALVAVVAVVAARAVVVRPRGLAPDEHGDDVLRTRSMTVIVAAVGLAVAAAHVGVALTAGLSLRGVDCAPAWAGPVAALLLLTVPVSLLVGCWCGVRLLVTDRLR